MSTFRVLVCGEDIPPLQQVTQLLQSMNVEIRASQWLTELLNQPYSSWYAWCIDVEGVSSLLRKLLPALRRRLPGLTMIGMMNRSSWERTSLAFGLDRKPGPAETAEPENVIVMFPCRAETYWLGTRYGTCETAPVPNDGLTEWQPVPPCAPV